MSHRPCLSLAVLVALFVSPSLYAQHAGAVFGGGHLGGSFGGSGFSGHSFGHAVGHSFGHIFGHRSGGHGSRFGKVPGSRGDEPPVAGAAFIHGKVVTLPGPISPMALIRRPPHPAPARFIADSVPRAMFPRNRQFGSGFCAFFGFSWHNFLFPRDFDCFGDPFLFDPFFSGGFIGVHFRSDSFITAGGFGVLPGPLDSPAIAEPAATTPVNNPLALRDDMKPSSASPVDAEEPVTLLQLRDGSMYGLTRYWVEGGLFHYVTDYGGENSVSFDRIDFEKTTQLNAARGTPFVLPADSPNL